jgi:chromosome segregation and condensation protein ScpB
MFNLVYLHSSPVVRQEGYCISQISKMFHSCAVSIVLCLIAAGYVIACQVLQAPKKWYLFASNHYFISHFGIETIIADLDTTL